MRSGSPKKSWFRQIVFVLFLVVAAANGQDYHEEAMDAANKYNKRGPFGVIKEKFNDLPPAGKFAASAAVGFVGSRVALKTFVSAAKIAGATFIAAEVLSVSGRFTERGEKSLLLIFCGKSCWNGVEFG